jgi:hypothetical protein
MNTVDFVLKHQVANIRYQELLAEAAKQRQANDAYALRARMGRSVATDLRAAVANVLFRAASWLTPDEVGGLELRPGR